MAKFNNAIAAFVYTSKLGLRMGDPSKSATRACYGLSDDLGMNLMEFVCAASGALERVKSINLVEVWEKRMANTIAFIVSLFNKQGEAETGTLYLIAALYPSGEFYGGKDAPTFRKVNGLPEKPDVFASKEFNRKSKSDSQLTEEMLTWVYETLDALARQSKGSGKGESKGQEKKE